MRKIRQFIVWVLRGVLGYFGYILIDSEDSARRKRELEQREMEFNIKPVDISTVPCVELLSLRVWTEGEKPCGTHSYRKVRALNSHRNSVAKRVGKAEHVDYICTECTHKMCSTKWGGADA